MRISDWSSDVCASDLFAITGTDYDRLAEVGDSLVAALRDGAPELANPRLNYATTQPQLSVRIDRDRVADVGIDITGLATALRSMVDGYDVADLNVDDRAVPIMLHASTGTRSEEHTSELQSLMRTSYADLC